MDGPRGYYAKRNVRQRKTNTTWFHLNEESKKQNKWTNIKQKRVTDTETNRQLPEERVRGEERGEGD